MAASGAGSGSASVPSPICCATGSSSAKWSIGARFTPSPSPKSGARPIREWRGVTHTVTVTEDGFEYAGTSYASPSKIAKKITGTYWSGPRFFGLLAAEK
ncbi:MAG: DUF2924 domain-containing protein [Xanthobacteraceae bacterium]